jgi:hypothetical protein
MGGGMTIREEMLKYLDDCAISQDTATAILDLAEAGEVSMSGRWRDQMTDYPLSFRAVVILAIRSYTLDWMNTNCP